MAVSLDAENQVATNDLIIFFSLLYLSRQKKDNLYPDDIMVVKREVNGVD